MRIIGYVLAAAGLVMLGLVAFVGWRSEAHIRGFASPPAFAVPIPTDADAIAHGRHIAETRGCAGCHGERLEGAVFVEGDGGFRAVAPSLTKLAHEHSPAVLERAIRHGIGHDGRALYSMPSYNFVRMTDQDIASLIGYLRSLPVEAASLPPGTLGWKIRWDIATGQDATIPPFIPKVPPLRWQSHADPAVRRGEYLAMTACNECHGFGLRGDDPWAPADQRAPDLAIVASYDRAGFVRLMRTGKAAGNREVGLMSRVARGRFVHWTDQEVDDLYAFLRNIGGTPPTL